MPEALEKWPVRLFQRLLPRHMEIIYEINQRFLVDLQARYPADMARLERMSIIENGPEPLVRMAYLAAVACFSVNGVAELHSELIKRHLLYDFYQLWPEKFNNKTNGISPRRFILLSNPRLSNLLSEVIGSDWQTDLERMRDLEPLADQVEFQQAWRAVKRANKIDLAAYIHRTTGIEVDPDSMFDVMVKRLHEYKRQLLKVLHIITLYNRLKSDPGLDIIPRTFIFGAKAAPGYHLAKLIIKLVNSVAEVINQDPDASGKLQVVFLPNFNVTLGELIYPAADLSEQISLAGKEASGTGNMKFALNGAVTIGTLDGANIEIRERVGEENFFLFGLTAAEVSALKGGGYHPQDYYQAQAELRAAVDLIAGGRFSHGDTGLFKPILDSLLYQDEWMLLADYAAFIDCQDKVDRAFRDVEAWTKRSILNAARCGYFSSDRAIRQYCEDIWKVKPLT
jgi:starch phosphorylase